MDHAERSSSNKVPDDPKIPEAFRRYEIIAELVSGGPLTRQEYDLKRKEAAEKGGVCEKTIDRWVEKFVVNKSIEDLKSGTSGRPGIRAFSDDVLKNALALKIRQPKRSIRDIVKCLEIDEVVMEGQIKRSTLQYQFNKAGFGNAEMASYENAKGVGSKRFERKERNALWQGDTKYGPYIDNQRTYLISFMDDHSRYICHSKFYFAENAETVMDSLQIGIVANGAPDQLYIDNGTPFNNASIDRACMALLIKKTNHPPYQCWKKGKIEKFHQVVDKFLLELDSAKATDLAVLNFRWQAYLHVFYQTIKHDALPDEQTPREAYDRSPREKRYISAEVLENSFLMVVKRTVDKTGCVNFHCKKFTGDGLEMFHSKKVSIFWKPNDKSTMWAEYENSPPIPISELVIPEHLPKRRRIPLRLGEARMMNENSKSGSRILDAAEKAYKDMRASHGFADSRDKEDCSDNAPKSRSDEAPPSHEVGVTSSENAQDQESKASETRDKTGRSGGGGDCFSDIDKGGDEPTATIKEATVRKPLISFANLNGESDDDTV
jgi:transposase InsO family protein